MTSPMEKMLFWTPRILAILFASFVSLFALDVFMEGYDFWETSLALMMHLIPTGLILLSLAIAWRWERVGGILFVALGVLYIVRSGYLVIVIYGPLFLVGVLFLAHWYYKSRQRASAEMK